MSALLLAWLHKYPSNLRLAVESALGGLQAILLKTHESAALHSTVQSEDKAGVGLTIAGNNCFFSAASPHSASPAPSPRGGVGGQYVSPKKEFRARGQFALVLGYKSC